LHLWLLYDETISIIQCRQHKTPNN